MSASEVHLCACPYCQQEAEHPDRALHRQMNLFLSRLDEQQRRWYVALEAKRQGRGGIRLLAHISGLDDKTIRRGMQELAGELTERPVDRVRLPGGGRPGIEKKTP